MNKLSWNFFEISFYASIIKKEEISFRLLSVVFEKQVLFSPIRNEHYARLRENTKFLSRKTHPRQDSRSRFSPSSIKLNCLAKIIRCGGEAFTCRLTNSWVTFCCHTNRGKKTPAVAQCAQIQITIETASTERESKTEIFALRLSHTTAKKNNISDFRNEASSLSPTPWRSVSVCNSSGEQRRRETSPSRPRWKNNTYNVSWEQRTKLWKVSWMQFV